MDRRLSSLDPRFRPLAVEFLARLCEAGVAVIITNTRRTAEEQARLVADGKSWVSHSLHEDGLALDVAVYEQYRLYGPSKLRWDSSDPVWARLAGIAEDLGLTSGYRWRVRDCGHVELPSAP